MNAENEINISSLLIEAGEAVVFFDKDEVVRYCNDVYLKGLGLQAADVIGKTPAQYAPSSQRSVFYDLLQQLKKQGGPVAQIGYSHILKRWLMLRVFPVQGGAIVLANDATESIVKQHMLAGQATKDHLTGLPNKLAMTTDADYLIQGGNPFSFLVLTLERFSNISDTLDNAGGDMALMEIASAMQLATLDHERLYRLGSTKFALLSRCAPEDVAGRFEAMRLIVETPVKLRERSFVLGTAGGASHYPSDGETAEELLKRAKLAHTESRRGGHGKVHFYAPSMEVESILRAEIEMELRDAILNDQLHLVFQPKGDMISGITTGAEALIRWNHPQRGPLSPAEFLGVAHDSNLMKEIDAFVLKKAVETVAQWATYGLHCPISINLSGDSLSERCLVRQVAQALEGSGIAPSMLEIEIPEGTLMADQEASIEVLNALRKMGVGISVDDFGTGYSSFSYLAKFPIDTLKIDRSFIAGIQGHECNKKIVKAIIQMAHSLELQVVAEGVKTAEESSTLRNFHCNTVQGYFYGKPMGSEEFITFAMLKNATRKRMSAFSV